MWDLKLQNAIRLRDNTAVLCYSRDWAWQARRHCDGTGGGYKLKFWKLIAQRAGKNKGLNSAALSLQAEMRAISQCTGN